MRSMVMLVAGVALAGCQMLPGASPKGVIVYGESRAATSDAVKAAQNAMDAAANSGCRPISIGSGAYAGSGERGGGEMVNVVVLLECPVGVNILAATGGRVP